ncbi:MAG: hypothetical protein KF869_14385 [Phycisphaeraceae bacterium]|nr:hypothetical protein [Phycisphaeraceae bacterium]
MHTSWADKSAAQVQSSTANIAARPEMAQTKVDQTLEPTHRIKFDGSDRISHISFSPDGHTAYCLVPGQRVDLWALGREWWPELLGGVLTLLVLAYLLVLLRVLRRPQRRGAPHCRNCNYDVTVQAPHSVLPRRERQQPARGTLCPECGTDLSLRRPRRGRSLARRMLVPSVLLGVCAAGYIALHAARVPRTGPLGNAPEVWSSWVDDLDARHKLAAIRKHQTAVARIIRVDTRTGEILGALRTMRGYPMGDMRVSPDGRFIAVVGDPTTLLWIRTSDGRTVARTSGGEFRGGGVHPEFVVGFSGPAHSPWVYFAAVDLAAGTSRLVRWRPGDGIQQVVIEEPAYEMAYANGVTAHHVRRYALLHWPEGIATVSAPSFTEAHQTSRYELTVRGDVEHGSQVVRVIPVRDSFVLMSPLVPSPEGQSLFLSASSRGIIGIDLRTGETLGTVRPALAQPPNQELAMSADGQRLFVPVFPNSVLVRDISQRRWVAELKFPPEFIAPTPEPSPDGRWLAVVAFHSNRAGAGARYLHELFLYDLSAIGKEPASASSPDRAGEGRP